MKNAEGNIKMNRETYERTYLEITQFDNEDVIATSGITTGTPKKDKYEGGGIAFD